MIGRALLVVCALLPLCWGITLDDLQQCPYAGAPLPSAIRSSTCGDGPRCQVSASGNINLVIEATAPYDSSYVTPNLAVVIAQEEEDGYEYDVIIPVELPEYIGCEGLENGCPIASGDALTWSVDWTWEPTVVEVGDSHTAKFTLYDENEIQIACFKMEVDIVA